MAFRSPALALKRAVCSGSIRWPPSCWGRKSASSNVRFCKDLAACGLRVFTNARASHEVATLEWAMERILVVDDDVELCALVAEYLEPEGFSVDSAHDGLEGTER